MKHSFWRFGALLGMLGCLSGCTLLGYAAATMPKIVDARYKGLKGQSVGVMVWVDQSLRMDWGSKLQTDLAGAVQSKLIASKADQVKETTFPVDPRSIVRYQQDHPQIESMDIAQVAPKLGVSRLIFIEVEDFNTRSAQAVDLYRGSAAATIKVIEVAADRTARVAYHEDGVRVVFPPKSPEEGVPGGDGYKFYLGTVDALATQVTWRFIKHEEEP